MNYSLKDANVGLKVVEGSRSPQEPSKPNSGARPALAWGAQVHTPTWAATASRKF